jgi:hypothetical protein
VTESRKSKCDGQDIQDVSRKQKNACKILVGNIMGTGHLGKLDVDGRINTYL